MSKGAVSKHHLEVSSSLCAPILLSNTDALTVPCGRAEITEGASPGEAEAWEQSQHSRDMAKPSASTAPSSELWLEPGGSEVGLRALDEAAHTGPTVGSRTCGRICIR